MPSGPAGEVKKILRNLEAEGIFNRALDTNSVPYHSPSLDPLLPELQSCMLMQQIECLLQSDLDIHGGTVQAAAAR